jgi:putative transposase
MRYGFVARMSAQYAVERLCQTLSVSRSGYYAWKKRKPSQRVLDNQLLTEHMQRIHQHSRGTYGSPRLQAALRKAGWRVNHKRVARLMRLAGLVGRRKVRRVSTTHSRHPYPVAPNRLGQEFSAQAPNQKWVGDITYIPTAEGWLYGGDPGSVFTQDRGVGDGLGDHRRPGREGLADGSFPASSVGQGALASFGSG